MSMTFIQWGHLPFTSLSMFSRQIKSAVPKLSISSMWLLTGHQHAIYPWLFPKLSQEDLPLPWALVMSSHVKPYFLHSNMAQTVRQLYSSSLIFIFSSGTVHLCLTLLINPCRDLTWQCQGMGTSSMASLQLSASLCSVHSPGQNA